MDYIRSLNNKEIIIEYDNFIHYNEYYLWLNAFSKELEQIRINAGLQRHSKISMPPDQSGCFHITIGNTK